MSLTSLIGVPYCRFSAIMAPPAIKLQHALQTWKAESSETTHNAWFSRTFVPAIDAVLQIMKAPDSQHATNPGLLLKRLKALNRAVKATLRYFMVTILSILI